MSVLPQPPSLVRGTLARDLGARMVPLLVVMVVAVTLSAPVASFVVAARALRDSTTATARDVARVVAVEAEGRPALWQYDAPKLAFRLATFRTRADVEAIAVTDPSGRLIDVGPLDLDGVRRVPLVWSRSVVRARGAEAADVWVASRTTRVRAEALALIAPFSLLGVLLAALLWFVARHAIVRAELRIERSHAELIELAASLEREVARRNAELAVAYETLREREERLRQLSTRALALQESERRAIARDLHDSAGQALTAIRIHLQLLAHGTRPHADMMRLAEETMRMTDATLEDLRRAVQLLAPAILSELGLASALERELDGFAERTGIATERSIELGVGTLHDALETTVYRILQEAMTNVARHAQASRIRVAVRVEATELIAELEDDGVGLTDAAWSSGGSGLRGMRERAELAGGVLTLAGAAGGGTLLRLSLPIRAPHK